MAANAVIHQIESLPREEQAKVIQFAYRLDAQKQLSGKDLAALPERMVNSTDPGESAMLREAIVRGFYGVKPNA